MTEHFINLTDGTRLSVKVNFGTLYYLQRQKGYYRIMKKVEKNPKSLTYEESFEMTANIIYALLRSNGRVVSFDEALGLVPADTKDITRVLDAFQEEIEKYDKKKTGEDYEDTLEIDWVEYMLASREMGMSEDEFWNSDPIFFNRCYERYQERRIKEVEQLYGR